MNSKNSTSNLTNFIFEVRKKDGREFPPNSIHHIVCGLQRYLRLEADKPNLDIWKDAAFVNFRRCLDSEMKRLQRFGVGSKVKKAEVISEEAEELLWQKKLLGDHSPQSLVATILYMNGLYFALRSGQEHRQLRHDPCQISIHERPNERAYLEYTDDISKNRSGGLKGRKLKAKVVQHHENIANPDRCFVSFTTVCVHPTGHPMSFICSHSPNL